jgi:HK97 family phage major capsid protein
MNLKELKAKYQGILDKAKTENRSLSAAETADLDGIKKDIERLEAEAATAVQNAAADAAQNRSASAAGANAPAQSAGTNADVATAVQTRNAAAAAAGNAADPRTVDSNTYLRSISRGGSDVGNREVVNDVVRQFEEESPIFAAHTAKQLRLTGNTYSYPKVTATLANGYKKTEGNAGTDDTTSAITMVNQTFSTYDGESILVTQEMLDDSGFDVAQEVIGVGSAKAAAAFDSDAVDALESVDATPTETATTSWALSDLTAAFFELPNRNRMGVKYTASGATIGALVSLMTNDNLPQRQAIGFLPENLLTDDNVTADLVIVGNISKALAVGMKTPVRVFVDETSKGKTFEVQPRMAVGLRDSTAVALRKKKAS